MAKRIDADHIYGLPDIRSYCQQQHQSIPVYGSAETLATLQRASDYAFRRPGYTGGGVPTLLPMCSTTQWRSTACASKPCPWCMAACQGCQGYRIGDMAYIPDARVIPESTLERMQGLDLLILNCLRATRVWPESLLVVASCRYPPELIGTSRGPFWLRDAFN